MRREPREEREFEEKVVEVRRVTKVVTGGKRMGFRVLTVVGDKKGRVGVATARSAEVAVAIRKSVDKAKKNLVNVILQGSTIPHEIIGKLGASRVLLRPAPSGRGVIAGGAIRVVLELAGIRDVVAKSLGSSNAVNCAKATINALVSLRDISKESKLRGHDIKVRFVQEESKEEEKEEVNA